MPTPISDFYQVLLPRFSVNAAGSLITASFPVVKSHWTTSNSSGNSYAADGVLPSLQDGESYWMASRYATGSADSSYYVDRGFALCDVSGGAAIDDAYYPPWDTLQFGYALYPANSVAGRPTTGYIQFAEVPLKKKYSLATFSASTISATFATPSESSRFAVAVRLPGGTASIIAYGQTLLPNTWKGWDFSYDPDPLSWYSPGVSISASGGASVGKTCKLTITVPDSVRTLTASDLVVTGGTISNFTKVS
jgi:hypothetical protein